MKICPYCAEDIQDAARVCKHCGRELDQHVPTQQELAHRKDSRAALGCAAALIFGLAWLLWLYM